MPCALALYELQFLPGTSTANALEAGFTLESLHVLPKCKPVSDLGWVSLFSRLHPTSLLLANLEWHNMCDQGVTSAFSTGYD